MTIEMDGGRLGPFSRRRALASFAGIAALGATASVPALVSAQGQAGNQGSGGGGGLGAGTTGIVVNGNGSATAPAETAILQIMVRRTMPPDGEATPEGAGYAGGKGEVTGTLPAPTADDLAPVVDALVKAGVAKDHIVIQAGTDLMSGPFGPGVSIVAASIDDKALIGALDDVVSAALAAAREATFSVDQVGAIYAVAGCDSLGQQALKAAVDDARNQATMLAAALGVKLGDLAGATMYPLYSPYSGYLPGATGCAALPTLDQAGSVYFPPYVAGVAPQFQITGTVTLTFAFS